MSKKVKTRKKKQEPKSMQHWSKPEQLKRIEEWAAKGLTMQQIANNIGVHRATLWRWKEADCNICNSLHTGNEIILEELENALIKKAMGYEREEITYNYDEDGNKIPVRGRVIHYPPDTPALKYAMNNKSGGKWADKVEYSDPNMHSKVDELLEKFEESAKDEKE